MLLLDLFFAGMETTVTTLKWGFLMMCLHPEIQERVQQELDYCNSDTVTLADRSKLPYTQATINVGFFAVFEILRHSIILLVREAIVLILKVTRNLKKI